MAAKNTILKAKIENTIYEMMVKTTAANVYVDDSTTLAAKLSALIADIATKASSDDLTTGLAGKADSKHTHAEADITGLTAKLNTLATSESVTSAIDGLRQEMLGDTPVEAYNTFTELAAYIADHKEVSDALTEAVGKKADKATTISGYGITDAYTKTETDKKISDAVATATGGESAASVKTALESYKTSNDARVNALEADTHTHANKTVLDGITEGDITVWNNKSNTKIYYSETQPTNLAEGDLWFALT